MTSTERKVFIGDSDRYEISDRGRVWSNFSQKYLTLHRTGNGYLALVSRPRWMHVNKWSCLIHVLVAKHFVPNPDNKPFVNHKDNDRMNLKRKILNG